MSDDSRPDAVTGFRLRTERPRVTRLSGKVLAGLVGIASLAILGSVIWALHGKKRGQPMGPELFNTDNKTTPDGLASLPKDYIGPLKSVPQLGPPLPGDLGRPILKSHATTQPASGLETAEQRIAQESEAARTSRLFSITSVPERPVVSEAARTSRLFSITSVPERPVAGSALAATVTAAGAALPLSTDQKPPLDPDSLQNMQDRKQAFLGSPVDRRTVSPDRLTRPVSSYTLQAGSIISAALITGVKSDLPGMITAQVTENVYDSPSGRFLLVPQGSKMLGTYDSQVSFGQSRVLLLWNRIVLPNGDSIVLEPQPGADAEGYAGLEAALTIIGAIC